MKKYQVYNLDVWAGNEEGEWELNNWFKAGVVEISEEAEEAEIIEILIAEGYFNESARGNISVRDECNGWLYIEREADGYPIYNLELIEQ